jgi:hypothetical protein
MELAGSGDLRTGDVVLCPPKEGGKFELGETAGTDFFGDKVGRCAENESPKPDKGRGRVPPSFDTVDLIPCFGNSKESINPFSPSADLPAIAGIPKASTPLDGAG